MLRSQCDLEELLLFFHHWGPRDENSVRLGQVSLLTEPFNQPLGGNKHFPCLWKIPGLFVLCDFMEYPSFLYLL